MAGFRVWFEDVLNHDKARALVLNAIDVPQNNHEAANDVLSVPLKAYPNIADKLASFPELQSHASEIKGWINSKKTGPTTVQQVIEFIATLDAPDAEVQQPADTHPQSIRNVGASAVPKGELPLP